MPPIIARAAAVWLVAAPVLCAASVELFSEFRRFGPDGAIVATDQAGKPREIISPAVVRGGYTSFHVVARGAPGAAYMLYIAQNPENVIRASVYRVPAAAPDRPLEPLKTANIPGIFPPSGVAVYWLDLWTPATAPVRRIRVEAQLNVGNDWVITPMEVRIQSATVPSATSAAPRLEPPPASASSGAAAFAAVRLYLCGGSDGAGPRGTPATPTERDLLLRNARQDYLLATRVPRATVEPAMLKLLQAAAADARAWCAGPAKTAPPPPDPETFLRIRDLLLRQSP